MTIKQDFARKAAERIHSEAAGNYGLIRLRRIAQIIRQEAKKAEKGGKR